jgi:hypothetical protein
MIFVGKTNLGIVKTNGLNKLVFHECPVVHRVELTGSRTQISPNCFVFVLVLDSFVLFDLGGFSIPQKR